MSGDQVPVVVASLIHEIRQPLGAIKSFASGCVRRIDAGVGDLDLYRRVLIQIRDEADRVEVLSRHLQRLFVGKRTSPEATDLGELLGEAVSVIPAADHAAAVDLEPAPGLPPVQVDRVLVRQAVLELLVNGLEAMNGRRKAGRLTVRPRALAAAVEVVFEDRSQRARIGDTERLFEPSYTTKPGHYGMGLWLARRVVEAHGGTLHARSGQAGGLAFVLTLPVKPPAKPHTATAPEG